MGVGMKSHPLQLSAFLVYPSALIGLGGLHPNLANVPFFKQAQTAVYFPLTVRLMLITFLADKKKVQGLTEEKKKNTSSIFRS